MDLSNLTINATFDPEDTFHLTFEPLEILIGITSLASTLADIIIVAIIARYTILRIRSNVYLANWCSCNLIVMVLVPMWLNLFGLVDTVTYEFTCIWMEGLYGVLFGNLLFVVILLLDWYIANYTRESCLTRCKQIHLFIIAIVWIVIISISSASVTFCVLNWSYPLTLVSFLLGYWIIFAVITIIFILRCIKIKIFKHEAEKSKLELFIVTLYFLCWFPNWVAMYGQIFLGSIFSSTFDQFTLFLGYSHAWVMLIVLYFYDKSFKECFKRFFGIRERSNDDPNVHKDQITGLL